MAELTVDLRRREQYLKLAREWNEAAAALQVCIDETDAAEVGCPATHSEEKGKLIVSEALLPITEIAVLAVGPTPLSAW